MENFTVTGTRASGGSDRRPQPAEPLAPTACRIEPNMTDLLLFSESLGRIREPLAERPGLRVFAWHQDGSITLGRRPVPNRDIAPEIGWISFDVFNRGVMKDYVERLARSERLKWVQTAHAGLDSPHYRVLAGRSLMVSKSWAQSIPIAEYVIAHALHYRQGIESRLAAQRAREWRREPFGEIYASRWLIIGFGHIGRRVAERLRPFECHIRILRRSGETDPAADEFIERQDLLGALSDRDVVVLACPETDDTRGLVNAEFVRSMQPGALLVNVARGGIIEDEALLRGLDAGAPGGAVLDVFNEEPLPRDHPYWTHPRVAVTAHMSSAGTGTIERGSEQFLGNLDRYLEGASPLDVVQLDGP